jgi:hypothetical protein
MLASIVQIAAGADRPGGEEEEVIVDRLAEALKEDTRLYQIWQRAFQAPDSAQYDIEAAAKAWQAQRRIVQQLEREAGVGRLAHLQVK